MLVFFLSNIENTGEELVKAGYGEKLDVLMIFFHVRFL